MAGSWLGDLTGPVTRTHDGLIRHTRKGVGHEGAHGSGLLASCHHACGGCFRGDSYRGWAVMTSFASTCPLPSRQFIEVGGAYPGSVDPTDVEIWAEA